MPSRRRIAPFNLLIELCAVAISLATVGSGAAIAHSFSAGRPVQKSDVAVVLEFRGKPAIGVLSGDSRGWRVSSRIPVNRGIRSIAWMPAGRKLAVTTAGGNLSNELRIIDVAQGAQRTLANAQRSDMAAFFGSVAWSPEGRRIAVTRSMGLYGADINIFAASGGSLLRSYHVSARYDSGLAWSRDGTVLYFAEQSTERIRPKLRRLVVRTGRVLPVDGVSGLDPNTRPDGALALTTESGIAIVRDGHSRKVVGSKKGDRFPTWLRKGNLLAERPMADCPRYGSPSVCSHIVVLTGNRGAARTLLKVLARNPATR
jgi:dipeptidyl aminopeptidase/acylaminoacyl peptidase